MRRLTLCMIAITVWLLTGRAAHADDSVQPTFSGITPAGNPAETYRLHAFSLVHEERSGVGLTVVIGGTFWRVTRGKFRQATTYQDFFRTVGRSDLADQYARRRATSDVLFWTGTAALLASVGLFGWDLLDGDGTDARTKAALGCLAGGLILTTVGSSIQYPSVDESEAAAMADAYNARLRVHLGLSSVAPQLRQRPDRSLPVATLTVGGRW